MNFAAATFLIGMTAAMAPVAIHMLNRRRYRVIQWAAMPFLTQAIRRSRRMLELRDLLLLALRTLAIICFILAMARPYWVTRGYLHQTHQPIHLLAVVDNSLSMHYRQVDRPLLETAKQKLEQLIQTLPPGSVVSIIPTISRQIHTVPAQQAKQWIQSIQCMDSQSRPADIPAKVRQAIEQRPELQIRQLIILTDRQNNDWSDPSLGKLFQTLPPTQLIRLGSAKPANSWIHSFVLTDGVADAAEPTTFTAVIRHQGDQPRRNVLLTLSIDDQVVEERRIDLLPDQHQEVTFTHHFNAAGDNRHPLFATAKLSITPDRLQNDDCRYLVVPVLARVPVLFIDQYGAENEKPEMNRYGDTYVLRRLLSPKTRDRDPAGRHLVHIRHLRMTQLDRRQLQDARLVVVAGAQPPDAQQLRWLRQYVEQGGQLLIIASGRFDPKQWQQAAWQDGAGILPLPLADEPFGTEPQSSNATAKTFHLNAESLTDNAFHLELDPAARQTFYTAPFFFKAVKLLENGTDRVIDYETRRIRQRRQWLMQYHRKTDTQPTTRPGFGRQWMHDQQMAEYHQRFPNWLQWHNPLAQRLDLLPIEQRVNRMRPMVVGRFDHGLPFAVRRSIDHGQVVMLSSGPGWNSLVGDYGILIFDRFMRQLLTGSVPSRMLNPRHMIELPIDPADHHWQLFVRRPGEKNDKLMAPQALGPDSFGLRIPTNGRRGIYRIRCMPPATEDNTTNHKPRWQLLLAMNGPAEESDLTVAETELIKQHMAQADVALLEPEQAVTFNPAMVTGHTLRHWLLPACISCLIAEMALLWWYRRTLLS